MEGSNKNKILLQVLYSYCCDVAVRHETKGIDKSALSFQVH